MKSPFERSKPVPPKHERLTDERIAALFHQFHASDEALQKDEVMSLLLEKLHIPRWAAERAWSMCDRNHDGSVSIAEFQQFIHDQEDSIEHMFAEIDTDGNGTLDKGEIDRWLHAHGVRATPEDEAHLMAHFSCQGQHHLRAVPRSSPLPEPHGPGALRRRLDALRERG